MPTSANDTTAVLIALASMYLGSFLFILAKRRYTPAQLTYFAKHRENPLEMLLITIGMIASYYYAPVIAVWPLVLVVAIAAFVGFRLARLHAGQGHTVAIWMLLGSGFVIIFCGATIVVVLRAAG